MSFSLLLALRRLRFMVEFGLLDSEGVLFPFVPFSFLLPVCREFFWRLPLLVLGLLIVEAHAHVVEGVVFVGLFLFSWRAWVFSWVDVLWPFLLLRRFCLSSCFSPLCDVLVVSWRGYEG